MDLSREELLNKLQNMDEYEFEELIADIWEKFGWNTKVTSGSHDRGVDVIAERKWPVYQKHLIQAKRYSSDNTIGSSNIQQYSSLRQQKDKVDSVIVITTGNFTTPAMEVADKLDVKTIDKDRLVYIIENIEFDELLNKYFDDKISVDNMRKITRCLQESEENSDQTQYISVETGDSGKGYVVYPKLFGKYNVHMFYTWVHHERSYAISKKNIIRTTRHNKKVEILLERNNRMYICQKSNKAPEPVEVRALIDKFLKGVFSISVQNVDLLVDKYAGKI